MARKYNGLVHSGVSLKCSVCQKEKSFYFHIFKNGLSVPFCSVECMAHRQIEMARETRQLTQLLGEVA